MNSNDVKRQSPKIPKDGFGPRGAPDCYYTSRVLNSTALYVKFVKKLRQQEGEERIRYLREQKEKKETLQQKLFIRCDRRAYQEALKERREKLLEMLSAEEKRDIQQLVTSVQEGIELAWNEKMNRIKYLLAKRQKEHEDRFKDTPLSKSAHVLPCIYKIRGKEAEEIQLYQMREKQMRKLAEKEMDKMWNEVLMKETEALCARSEYEVIERYRRDQEAKQSCLEMLEQRRVQRAKEQEILRQETLKLKAKFEKDDRKAEAEEREREEIQRQVVKDMSKMMEDRKQVLIQRQADAQVITDVWDSLATQGLADEKIKEQKRRQKQMELNECNRKMIEMKNNLENIRYDNDPLIFAEGQRRQDAADLKRCQYRVYTRKLRKQIGEDVIQQMKEKEEALRNQYDETVDYNQQVTRQLDTLVKHKELTDAQAKKLTLKDLKAQIEYRKILQERAKQELIAEEKKCKIAKDQYQEEINKMLARPFFSDKIHPFMKPMASGLKKCPCGPKPTYCSYSKRD